MTTGLILAGLAICALGIMAWLGLAAGEDGDQ